MARRRQALAPVAANRALARWSIAWLLFIVSEYAVWTVMLVFAYGRGGATTAGVFALAQLITGILVGPLLSTIADRRSPVLLLVGGYVVQTAGMAMTALVLYTGGPALAAYGGARCVGSAFGEYKRLSAQAWRSCGPRAPACCSTRSTSRTMSPSASSSRGTGTPRRSSSTLRTSATSWSRSWRRPLSPANSSVSRAQISGRACLTARLVSAPSSSRCSHLSSVAGSKSRHRRGKGLPGVGN
jgi:hypothetical protein